MKPKALSAILKITIESKTMSKRELFFIEKDTESYVNIFQLLISQGYKNICLDTINKQSLIFIQQISDLVKEKNINVFSRAGDSGNQLSENIPFLPGDIKNCIHFIFVDNQRQVSSALMDYIDLESGLIVAPIISIHSSLRSLFLISIPKSGTHLLYELADALGYNAGVYCPEQPEPQNWYCLQGTNSHTEAKDFLLESAKKHYFAQRNHSFNGTPTLLIYRNPLDIVVSEANYYHKPESTVFSGYLSHLSFEQRLEKLIDDPWLLGSIRDRIAAFIPWLEFRNIIPISFEELVGAQGGGCTDMQVNLIWSLQLKLHISGNPAKLAEKVFNTESATFHHGRLGAHKEKFTQKAYELFNTLPQDFMSELGYCSPTENTSDLKNIPVFSSRVEEFRKRPLETTMPNFDDLPICAEHRFNEHNIIKFRRTFFAIPITHGEFDISTVSSEHLSQYLQHDDIQQLKRMINKQ